MSAEKQCIVLQHVAFESLGVFAGPLAEAGYAVRYVQVGLASPDSAEDMADWREAALVVILGGPIGVGQEDIYPFLRWELTLAETRLASGRPLLGICLGAQLMAAALGARVHAGRDKEIGWGTVELTPAGRDSPLAELAGAPVLHWHGDTFELPAGTDLLAFSAMTPHQAFRAGRGQLALQFHPEADAARMETWLIGHCCELAQAGSDPRHIRADALRLGAAARRAGQSFFRRWLAEEIT